MKLHRVEVLSRERFGDHILLQYRWDADPPEPGQFVMVRPERRALDPFLSRPFFAHDYGRGRMSLLFEVRGRGTALLAEESEGLLVSAPLGRGFVLDAEGPAALVGGGVWVAPLKLLVRRLRERGTAHHVYLEVPAAAPKAYASLLAESYPHATLVPTAGGAGAPRVVLGRLGDLSRYGTVHASGPTEMLAAVKDASGGVVSAQLALRERMACANGSCYGCAVPVQRDKEVSYARACVEGPVFPAEVLAW